jgi:hypothetical protein
MPGSGTKPKTCTDVAVKLKLLVQLLGRLVAVIRMKPRLPGANLPSCGAWVLMSPLRGFSLAAIADLGLTRPGYTMPALRSFAMQKPRVSFLNSCGVLKIKPGDTYFRAGRHHHRPGKLNGVVRNRCNRRASIQQNTPNARQIDCGSGTWKS